MNRDRTKRHGPPHQGSPKSVFDPFRSAESCLAEHCSDRSLRYWNSEWYRWNGSAYGRISVDAVKRLILAHLRNGHTPINRSAVGAVLEMLRLATLVESDSVPCWLSGSPFPADEMVVAKNGLLHLPTMLSGLLLAVPVL